MHDGPAILKTLAGEPMALEGVTAKGRVEGLLFELEIEQRYRNRSKTNIEAVYSFPLPWGAVLLEIAFEIDGKKLSGVVVERPKAEDKYETAIEQGDSAILLEQAAPGLYTVSLGNLIAGETAVVRYRYAQLLRFEKGQVCLTVPTVIAPRYGDAEAAGLQIHQVPETDIGAEYPFRLSIEIAGDLATGAIASPSHRIGVERTEEATMMRLAHEGFLDRDFVLTIKGIVGRSLAVVARDGDGYVALASICPPLPAPAEERPLNLKILLDCSGSMAGNSIRTAKAALHRILERFTPTDHFALSRFGSDVEHFFPTLVAVDYGTIGAAAAHVAGLDADMGGTEMEQALQAVFALGARSARGAEQGAAGTDVLLITDGQIWNADELVAAARASGNRLFAVAIGAAPAENMLRRLAEETGGACEFVAPREDAEASIIRMFARLRRPPVIGLAMTWPLTPDWTAPLPVALFEGETIHLVAGFGERPTGEVLLTYRMEGEPTPQRVSMALATRLTEGDRLVRLGSALCLPALASAAATELAVRYQLVTEHTSCVIVHERAEREKAKSMPNLQRIAQMLPAGWGGVGVAAPMLESRELRLSSFAMHRYQLTSTDRHDVALERPAFLRSSANEATPADLLRRIERGDALALLGGKRLPFSIDDLAKLGAPNGILNFLRGLVAEGDAEEVVVAAFLEALAATVAGNTLGRIARRRLRNRHSTRTDTAALRHRLTQALTNTTSERWPTTSMPESVSAD